MCKKKQPNPDKRVTVLGAVFAVAFIIMAVALAAPREAAWGEFVPPAFEAAAETGIPQVSEDLGYIAPYQDGMAYRFAVCGNVLTEGNQAQVYFTNPAENTVWIKLRIFDGAGEMLGETGLLKPGQHVRYVALKGDLAPGTPIQLKIMGYEPDTYTSAGAALLNTAIGGMTQ